MKKIYKQSLLLTIVLSLFVKTASAYLIICEQWSKTKVVCVVIDTHLPCWAMSGPSTVYCESFKLVQSPPPRVFQAEDNRYNIENAKKVYRIVSDNTFEVFETNRKLLDEKKISFVDFDKLVNEALKNDNGKVSNERLQKISRELGLPVTIKNSSLTDCINFSGTYNLNSWEPWLVDPHTIQTDNTHGNYLELKDDDGGSFEVNRIEFSGNWLIKAKDKCFCFDYNVDWSAGNAATIPVKAPKIGIYTGNNNAANSITGIYATFVGNTTNADLQNNVWSRFCLPIDLCAGGLLPSNNLGTWQIMNGPTLLTGAAACTAWNNLIQNVTGIILFTDYNSFPGELVRFDNFCWSCEPTPTCCTGGTWVSKSIDWSTTLTAGGGAITIAKVQSKIPIPKGGAEIVGLPPTSLPITKCDSTYHLSQNGTYTFNANYQCGTVAGLNCAKTIKVKIKGLSNSSLDGLYNSPIAKTFSTEGNYEITYYAYCGDKVCDSCKYTLMIDKECCIGNQWSTKTYKTVGKSPKINGPETVIPLLGSGPVPIVNTSWAVNLSLSYSCPQGCPSTFKIKQQFGNGTPVETTLAVGQSTASIYPKGGNKTRVWIYPLCGGKVCGQPLVFDAVCNSCFSDTKATGLGNVNINSGVFQEIGSILKDIDGNEYPTISICNQVWTSKNLDVSHYRNGDPITQVQNPAQWANLTTGAWCYYNNDPNMGAIYGKLYNWYAINDLRGLAPVGWHIPNDQEWTTIVNCLGGESIAGAKMQETGTAHWVSPNTQATNSSGFTGLPGGQLLFNGTFNTWPYTGMWWSTTQNNTTMAWARFINQNASYIGRGYTEKTEGHSVRCVKD